MRRFLSWLVAPGLERLALANQARHKTDAPIPTN